MRTILVVAGAVWFALAAAMVLAIACAASRRMPQPPRRSRPTSDPVEAPSIVNSGKELISEEADLRALVES